VKLVDPKYLNIMKILSCRLWYVMKQLYLCKNFINSLKNSVYPEIQWDSSKFKTSVPRNSWKSVDNQRLFFNNLAKELGLKKMDHWYDVSGNFFDVTL
jgi:hypothetical protein